jgi:hypothetical protein
LNSFIKSSSSFGISSISSPFLQWYNFPLLILNITMSNIRCGLPLTSASQLRNHLGIENNILLSKKSGGYLGYPKLKWPCMQLKDKLKRYFQFAIWIFLLHGLRQCTEQYRKKTIWLHVWVHVLLQFQHWIQDV